MTWEELCRSGAMWSEEDYEDFLVVHNGFQYLSKQFRGVFIEDKFSFEIEESHLGFNVGEAYSKFKMPGEFLI